MNKIFLVLLGLCFYISSAQAQAKYLNYNQGTSVQSEYDITLPFDYIGCKIFIPVTIKDVTYRFCFDTGCPTMISDDLYQKLNFKHLDSCQMLDINHKNLDYVNVSIDELALGKLKFKDIPAAILPNAFIQCEGFDGIIGSNLFRNSIVRISYLDKTLRITDNRKNIRIKNKFRYLLHLPKNRSTPFVRVQLRANKNKAFGEFVFDTGDESLLSLSDQYVQFLKEMNIIELQKRSFGRMGFGLSGIHVDTLQERYLIPELKINKGSIKNVSAHLSLGPRLGCQLIEYGIVTIDYKNKSFAFEPYNEIAECRHSFFPIHLSLQEEKLIVGIIWDKKYTDISLGDQVIEIDGVNSEHVSKCELINNHPFKFKNKVKLKIRNSKGEFKTIEMERH